MGKILIFIGTWSFFLAAWTLANPPSGTVGTTAGIIATDIVGNVGIATNTPAATLDVNGTTTIRKSLDVTANMIVNVVTPIVSADAANKAYVDAQVAAKDAVKLWGQGRPGTAVVTVVGVCGSTSECYKDVNASASCNAGDIKIARSTRPASWDKSRAACPTGWWACSANDRDVNGATAGYGTCGSGNRTWVTCDMTQSPSPTFADDFATNPASFNTDNAWISNAGATTNQPRGGIILINGTLTENTSCSLLPVLCCAYQ